MAIPETFSLVIPPTAPETQAEPEPAPAPQPVRVEVIMPPPEPLKGKPIRVFDRQAFAALSDATVDVRRFNAVNVKVIVGGTNPSATVSIEGAEEGGANYVPLSDVNAIQHNVSTNRSFDVQVGTAFVRVRLADVSGSFTVIVTPMVAPAQDQPVGRLITLRASAAQTAGTETGAAVALSGRFKRFIAISEIVSSATDAGDTLDVYVDFSLDGATWFNAIHFTQQAGNGAARTEIAILDASAPGSAVVNVTADAASGAVRAAAFGPYVRYRSTVVDVSTANASHTHAVRLYAQ